MKYITGITLLLISVMVMNFYLKAQDAIISQSTGGKQTIVDYLGLIHAKGNKIVDKNNNPVALHGMSLYWSQWGGQFYNADCIRWLRDDWKCTIVRAACGVRKGGYLSNPDRELARIKTVIDACINLGIYVVVDWHDHCAENHLQQSKEFFQTIAKEYGNTPNIIYEIYNEPVKVSWSDVIKPYAEEIIKIIRQHDSKNLIIVGTPSWSQDVDIAAAQPIADTNIAYTFHYYSSDKWHKQNLRNKVVSAVQKGVPIFITEYGISEANGNGLIDSTETAKWFSFVDRV